MSGCVRCDYLINRFPTRLEGFLSSFIPSTSFDLSDLLLSSSWELLTSWDLYRPPRLQISSGYLNTYPPNPTKTKNTPKHPKTRNTKPKKDASLTVPRTLQGRSVRRPLRLGEFEVVFCFVLGSGWVCQIGGTGRLRRRGGGLRWTRREKGRGSRGTGSRKGRIDFDDRPGRRIR